MGEKIRDLHSIKIGPSEFMIELNAGGNSRDGRIIHIQNKHFRYLLKEKHFLQLAATVLRSKSEKDYLKKNMSRRLKGTVISNGTFTDSGETAAADYVCQALSSAGIPYRLIEIRPHLVTFIVQDEAYKKFSSLMKADSRMKKQEHLYSKNYGYIYLYKMRPFKLYLLDGTYIDFYFQLPCKSLTEKTWIPLHRSIQERVWDQNIKNEKSQSVLDPLTHTIYRLCWSVFEREAFSEYDIDLIKKNSSLLDSDESREMLYEVFFGYTNELIQHVLKDEFSQIIPSYYEFTDY